MEISLRNITRSEMLLVEDIHFYPDKMVILFEDEDEIAVPLAWFPKLYYASPRQLENWRMSSQGLKITWPLLDMDVSISSLIGR